MEVDLLSMVVGAVAAKAGGEVTGLAAAPVRAVGEHWKQVVLARLQRHNEEVDQLTGGLVEAPDSVRVKAGVEASLRDDDVAHGYLAGVVAGASDDAPTAMVAMIGRMSALDLRLHYLLYRELHRQMLTTGVWTDDIRDDFAVSRDLELFLQLDPMMEAMGVGTGSSASRRLLACLHDLAREGLIAPYARHRMTWAGPVSGFAVGEVGRLTEHLGEKRAVPTSGLIVCPTVTGMTLMAWVFSRDGTGDPASFRRLDAIPDLDMGTDAELRATLVSDLPKGS